MSKGTERGYWQTTVSCVAEDTVLIRGYPIEQLIGTLSYTEALFLTLKGRLPTREETRMLDAVLCSILDYAIGPASVVSRIVVSANPQMGAAMAASILAQGKHAVSPQDAGAYLEALAAQAGDDGAIDAVAAKAVREAIITQTRLPGLGHPSMMSKDPRAERLRECAERWGFWGRRGRLLQAVHARFVEATGRSLVINVDGMLGAILGDMGFSTHEMAALAAISMLPGIIANAVEEMMAGTKIRLIKDMEYTGPERRALASDEGTNL